MIEVGKVYQFDRETYGYEAEVKRIHNGTVTVYAHDGTGTWHWPLSDLTEGRIRAVELPRIYRASGEMVCSACEKDYYHHPVEEHEWALAAESPVRLHRLCNGDLVKT